MTRDLPDFRDNAIILIDQLKEIYIDGELDPIDTVHWFPTMYRKDYQVGTSDACVCAQHLEAGLDPRRPGQRMAAPHRLSTDRGDIPAGRCLRQRRRAGTGRHRPYYIPNVRCENGTAANSGMHRFHSASMRKPRMRRGVATWLGSGKLLGR